MNLKAIDAALAAYRELDEGEMARLAFFRKLWGALDEAAADAPAAEGWDAPCAEDLRTWFAAGEPVLAHAPATVGAAPFAVALGRAAACAAEHGSPRARPRRSAARGGTASLPRARSGWPAATRQSIWMPWPSCWQTTA